MEQKYLSIMVILIITAFILGNLVNIYEIFPYSLIKSEFLRTQTTNTENPVYENDIYSLIHVYDESLKYKVRHHLFNFIWKQNSIPKSEPIEVEKNITDLKYHDLQNLDSIDKLTINMEYGVNSLAYLFSPINSNGKLIIYHQGHSGDFFNGKKTIEYFLKKNYPVVAFAMPLSGNNSQPIIDIPQFGKIKFHSHNQFSLLENDNFTPMKFFIEPVIFTLNYLESHHDFDSYHMVGISGGGWTTTLIAALDERINHSFSIAGSYPMFLRSDPKNFGDYEQNNLEFYKLANYLDLYVMASTGPDRKFIQIFNLYDPCCFDGTSFKKYEVEIINTLNNFNEGYFKTYLDDSHKKHVISKHALEIIINELNS